MFSILVSTARIPENKGQKTPVFWYILRSVDVSIFTSFITSFMTDVPIMQKPVH